MGGTRCQGGVRGVLAGGRAAPAPRGSMDCMVADAREGGGGDGALPSVTHSTEAVASGRRPPHRLRGAVGVHELKSSGFPSVSTCPT